MTKIIEIEGMMCAHCTGHVQKALLAVAGVTDVNVSLESKNATLTLSNDVSDQLLMDTVMQAGYDPICCKEA